jgi:purine nucleosidase
MPTPVILDCDPGHDDVFAIWLAAGNPALDLKAITTVSGNGYLEYTSLNARIACTIAGIEGVPVAAGAARPLQRTLTPASWIHGENALGGPELPEPTVPLDSRTATELIADTLRASDEPVVLIPTGPLTNIAIFLQEHPELLGKIREIVWMGGSTTRGNVTPYAEFNASVDPEAIDVILRSGLPFTMVGLNITHQALITPEVMKRIEAIDNATSAFGVELLRYFCSTYEVAEKMPEGPLHDPVAVALVADPAVATTQRVRIDVELAGTETAGATSVDLIDILRREHNATVALDLDVERFWSSIEQALRVLK